jgi:hypothetical protein
VPSNRENNPVNGRVHDPSLRELTAELDGVRELLISKVESSRVVMDERDVRYEQRFKAMDEKTSLALTASEKAVSKAETATEKRFDAVNEFRGTLSDQARLLIPREEVNARFSASDQKIEGLKEQFQKDIGSLKETRSEVSGKEKGRDHTWAIALAIGLAVLGDIIAVAAILTHIAKL